MAGPEQLGGLGAGKGRRLKNSISTGFCKVFYKMCFLGGFSMEKGASKEEKEALDLAKGYHRRIPVGFTYDEWQAMERRMREQGETKIAPYLKRIEAQQGEITAFKMEKARELAFEMRKWQISTDMVLEAYKRL
jgi:hypothetical protein